MKKSHIIILYYLPPLLWLGLIFFLSNIPNLRTALPNTWDLVLRKMVHMAEFGILAILIFRMFLIQKEGKKELEKATQKQKVYLKEAVAAAIILSILYAFSDEFHQAFVVGRHSSLWDVGVDTLGIIIGVLIYLKRVGAN